jgi:hypothetical protein
VATPTLGGLSTPAATARPTTGGLATLAPGSPAATGGAATAGASGSPAAVTPFHSAPELEAVVPTSADGLALAVESVTGAGFRDGNGNHAVGVRCRWYEGRGLRCRDQKELQSALTTLGKTLNDVRIGVAYNETKDREIEVQATRVAGVSGAALLDAVVAVYRDAWAKRKRTLNVSTATLGGKSVTVITYASPYPLGLRRYLYATADTLYDIRRAYDAPATAILQGLP